MEKPASPLRRENNLEANPQVRSSEARFAVARLWTSPQQRALPRRVVWICRNEGILCCGETTHIPRVYKYQWLSIFFLHPFFMRSFASCSCLMCLFCRLLVDYNYYGSQEDHASQTTPLRLNIMGGTSPSGQSTPIHLSRAERLYNMSLCIRSFIPERGFLPQTLSSTSSSKAEDGRHCVLPRSPE